MIAIGRNQACLPTCGNITATYIGGIYDSVVTDRAVYIDSSGRLGTLASSRRYKEDIKPMGEASEALFRLKPGTFRYKKELDPKGAARFRLVAEEVAKVNPHLVVADDQGKPLTVRYEEVNAILLNEFLKEHRAVLELKSAAAKQETIIARQQKQIEALTAGLQKVSAELELNKHAPETVSNH